MDYVCVAVADAEGRLLMQERDEHAAVDPERWAFPGGGIEPGETAAAAARRELRGETGLDLALQLLDPVTSWCPACRRQEEFPLFFARADLTDADVTCGEGRRMVFVAPADTIDRELSDAAVAALPAVLSSSAYTAVHGRRPRHRFGSVILVDARGWVLLQERDEHPRIDPEKWGLSGGHLEPEESDASGAARELQEETGVAIAPEDLVHVGDYPIYHAVYDSVDTMAAYAARVRLGDADIDCREGRRIVFVDPDATARLPLTMSARRVVPAFLASPIYRSMAP